MNSARSTGTRGFAAALLAALAWATVAPAQEAPQRPAAPATQPGGRGGRGGPRGPQVVSPEVKADRHVTFRILAPKAEVVRLNSSDLPGGGPQQPRTFTKGENGVWELALGPVDPGTFRYNIDVDGLPVIDPRNPAVSESNGNAWSVVHVPGADFMDRTDVPHGAVAAVYYKSSALGRDRRMHVYTPPGYESSQDKYPVFYLLHGAGDSDDSWTSVGRANFILDNLIASGKAKPMIVVMPAGHTGPFGMGAPGGGRGGGGGGAPNLGANAFEEDFTKDIRPYVEKHYRVLTDRPNRAIAGLSMGGGQTLNIALPNLKDYAYVGVFSSGLLFRQPADVEKEFQGKFDDAKEGLKLLWFSTGSQDFLLNQTRSSVDLLKKLGLNPVFKESTGGHTWINWQKYLNEFAPQLFGGSGASAAAAGDARPQTGGANQGASVSGRWRSQFDTQIGQQKYTYDLKVDGEKLTGTATGQVADQPARKPVEIKDGKINGDQVSFTETFTFNENEITITYSGKLKGDELHLTRKVGDFATEEIVAKRESGDAKPASAGDSRSSADDKAPAGFDVRREGVARGKVETVEYDSKTVGVKRKVVIYTPPGFSKDQQYPVLYLLHGIGDDETGWWKKGSADAILDNLYADQKIAPMIVVMPNGRASADPPPANPFDGDPFRTFGAFEDDLLKDLIPFVESHYPAKSDRESRALAGLSMGGGQSLNFGLKHLDRFAWVGGFSSAPNTKPARELLSEGADAARHPRLLWLSCGDADRLMGLSERFHGALQSMNVPHVWHVDSGGHTWPVWKNDLYLFTQKLFQERK